MRINKTVGFDYDLFAQIVERAQETDVPFSKALNDLCREGVAAHAEPEQQTSGGSEDGGE